MLVPGNFVINPLSPRCPVFQGMHDPDHGWGPWAIPFFDTAETNRIIRWSQTFPSMEETLYWAGKVVVHLRAQDPTWEAVACLPNNLDMYPIGSQWWTWKPTDRPATGRRRLHVTGRRQRRLSTTNVGCDVNLRAPA